ncbi:MAG TPA: prepilin-type N-terminal cleavage/methylation domain-containing protein [Vicinamibacterales bacterium]|nr:prepilin-type N-terminal cleavage/methylation domain-containing protein [Vicinamibacterales bacterium]
MTVEQEARNRDAGFSLIEVLVAMIVVVPAVIGAAGMVTIAACAIRDARLESTAIVLASQKLEQMRALEWNADDVSGGPASSDTTTDLTRDPPVGGGLGLTPSPSGTLSTNVPGFVDFLDAGGQWVGTGATPPPRATFIRRWAVMPLPASSADSLALQVLVTTVARDAQVTRRPARRPRLPGEALVATVRTRTSRQNEE